MTIDPNHTLAIALESPETLGDAATSSLTNGAGAPTPAMTAPSALVANRTILPLAQTSANTQRPSSTAPTGLLPRNPTSVSGYEIYPIRHIDMQNSIASNRADPNIKNQAVGPNQVNANGTYYFNSNGQSYPAGPIVRGGEIDYAGPDVGRFRGGVALLSDGTIMVGRSTNSSTDPATALSDLERHFSPGSDTRLINFMGGGALLIENGRPTTDADLRDIQRFRNGAGGLNAPQLGAADRVLVGVRDGQAYLIGARGRTGAQNQQDLANLGFQTVVAFDGGSASYLRSHEAGTSIHGRPNSQAPAFLGIQVTHW